MAAFTHGRARDILGAVSGDRWEVKRDWAAGQQSSQKSDRSREESPNPGKFGRMFDPADVPPQFDLPDGAEIPEDIKSNLRSLADTMIENDVDVEKDTTAVKDLPRTSNMQQTPAGYTYLGQFIDHDLTFDPASKLQQANDVNMLEDFRTPAFDLDNVYGSGPSDQPYLYDNDAQFRFLVSANELGVEDLPRNKQGIALIGDKRNNENQIVGQLHLAFLKFHNAVFDKVANTPADDPIFAAYAGDKSDKFALANRIVRYHYQWLVLTDFLPKIVKPEVLTEIYKKWNSTSGGLPPQTELQKPNLKFYDPAKYRYPRYMPVEFSVAAYRFGHSMVRRDYAMNKHAHPSGKEVPIFAPFGALDLKGFQALKPELKIDWDLFFGEITPDNEVQPARSIDSLLVSGLGTLPAVVAAPPPSLAFRNLMRGVALGLPSGEAIAEKMRAEDQRVQILTPIDYFDQTKSILGYQIREKGRGAERDPSIPNSLNDETRKSILEFFRTNGTPLWYYILKEAELQENGACLGWVGSYIVAETFIGLLTSDPSSFINNAGGEWQPKGKSDEPIFGCEQKGKFGIVELLQFAGAMERLCP